MGKRKMDSKLGKRTSSFRPAATGMNLAVVLVGFVKDLTPANGGYNHQK